MRKKKKTHTVLILPEDFKGAKYCDNENCPLARAMKRHFKADWVNVGNQTAQADKLHFIIELKDNNGFDEIDFEFVKAIKEPYPVELTEY